MISELINGHNFTDTDWWLSRRMMMMTIRRIFHSYARRRLRSCLTDEVCPFIDQENVVLKARTRLQDGDLFRIEVVLCKILPSRHSIVLSHTALFPWSVLSLRWSSWSDATWFPCRHVQVALDNTWHWWDTRGRHRPLTSKRGNSLDNGSVFWFLREMMMTTASCNCRAEPGNTRRVVKYLCHDSKTDITSK